MSSTRPASKRLATEVRRAPPPELPLRVVTKTLRSSASEERLLRRLGQALVLQWDALSDEMQDVLIDQAIVVDDRDEPVAADEVEAFIRTAKTAALKPKTQAGGGGE